MPEYSEVEREQVKRAHDKYTLPEKKAVDPDEKYHVNKDGTVENRLSAGDDFNPDAPERTVDDTSPLHEVKRDNDERLAHAGESHEQRTNAELQLNKREDDVSVVVPKNRAGVDSRVEDTQGVEDLELEVLVREARESGKLAETGGPMGNYTGRESLSPYVDGTWLAEASKQTGEKYF